MRKKVLFGYDYTENEIAKLVIYLFVGGMSGLFELAVFYILFNYLLAPLALGKTALTMASTAGAFCLSTLFHYFLGNVLVFDSGSRYQRGKELTLVFLVSAMGLVFNLLLMYLFVSVLSWHPMMSKVLTSCIVVVWNYLSRKKWIFRS